MSKKKEALIKESTEAYLIAGFILILVSFLLDDTFFNLFDKLKSSIIDASMNLLSSMTIIVLFFIIASIYLVKRTHNFVLLWASIMATFVVDLTLKLLIARPRPFGLEKFLLFLPDYSFPSMHTALMFSVVYILGKSFPKERWFFAVYALLVGLSRIYLKAHYFSDVIAGAFLGFFMGYFVFFLEKKYKPFDKLIKIVEQK